MNAKEMSIYSKVGMEEKCVTVGFGGIRQMIFSQNLTIYERDFPRNQIKSGAELVLQECK